MPRVITKIEGRGNGVKTVVTNMGQIAAALRRDPLLLTKVSTAVERLLSHARAVSMYVNVSQFFGHVLGAQSKYNSTDAKAVINGAHPASAIQTLISVFVGRFVLCPKCDLPETVLVAKQRTGTVHHKCAACGAKVCSVSLSAGDVFSDCVVSFADAA